MDTPIWTAEKIAETVGQDGYRYETQAEVVKWEDFYRECDALMGQ